MFFTLDSAKKKIHWCDSFKPKWWPSEVEFLSPNGKSKPNVHKSDKILNSFVKNEALLRMVRLMTFSLGSKGIVLFIGIISTVLYVFLFKFVILF